MMYAHSPFDELAQTYDADFTASAIGQAQRNRVWTLLAPVLNESGKPLKILEINCGTGEDAVRLAALGHHVISTDASAKMIGKAKEKTKDSINSVPQFIVCPFDRLSQLFQNEKFDLVFSNFGGLNCINKKALSTLSGVLDELTTGNGKLVLVLLGNCCLWEIGHYVIRGRLGKAFRRFQSSTPFTINGQSMRVRYYSPASLKKSFSPAFTLQQKSPVGLFIPPSYLENKFTGNRARLASLEKREQRFGYSFLAGLADHYCAIFNKTSKRS